MENSKNKVIEYLRKTTSENNLSNLEVFTTQFISEKLHLSRSLVSFYLNELYKEGLLIKVSTRPVYYFDKRNLENIFNASFENEYLNRETFISFIENIKTNNDIYKDIVGNEGSLFQVINQLKTAALYPSGLPVMLKGEKGTGKKTLANLTTKFINQNKNTSIKVEFHEFDAALMDEVSSLKRITNSLIYIKNLHSLSVSEQEKLSDYVNEQQENDGNRLIFSILPESMKDISQNLLLNIPVVCNIPSWSERYKDERLTFVVSLLEKEEELFQKRIIISNQLIENLINASYSHNIEDVKRNIKSICANAYAENISEESIIIYPYHGLNKDILYTESIGDHEVVSLDELKEKRTLKQIIKLWDKISDQILLTNLSNEKSIKSFVEKNRKNLESYYNFLIFEETYNSEEAKLLEQKIVDILTNFSQTYYLKHPINFSFVLARMLIIQNQYRNDFMKWEKDNAATIHSLKDLIDNKGNRISDYTNLLLEQLKSNFNSNWFSMNELFMFMNVYQYNSQLSNIDTTSVILCHGYSTASSIADTVNTLLKVPIFEAIDVPINSSNEGVIEKINRFLQLNNQYENILFLVDMGSLEEIVKDLKTPSTVGIMNNVSTLMALEIGNEILQGKKLFRILHDYNEKFQLSYHIREKQIKAKAIVFASDVSVEVAEKLAHLFEESLPKSIPLKIIPYDNVIQNDLKELHFFLDQYEVVLMVRPINIEINNISNVALEDIINFNKEDMIFNILREFLDEDELEVFEELLLKNFSLHSLINKLIILNPYQLLDQVTEAITTLQRILKRKLNNRTIIGLNLHICFLIEKLVTKAKPTIYRNVDEFTDEHAEFIEIVRESFEDILKNYHVVLPISEIAYIYDYVQNDFQSTGNYNNEF